MLRRRLPACCRIVARRCANLADRLPSGPGAGHTSCMEQLRHNVYRALSRTGARPEATLTLPGGQAFVRWINSDGETRYEQPGHHTLSVYLDGGRNTERIEAGRVVARGFPGAVCVLPSDHVSGWRIGAPFHRLLHFYFDQRQLTRTFEQTWDVEPAMAVLEPQYLFEDHTLAHAARLIHAGDWTDAADRLGLDHLAQWFLLYVAQHHIRRVRSLPPVRGRLSNRQAARVRACIEEHLDRALTLETLAGEVNLSPYHFARLFRVTFGRPPHQYVMQRRMDKARNLVIRTDDKLVSIALRCGFNDHSQFTRAFRRHHGMTPSKLRGESGC